MANKYDKILDALREDDSQDDFIIGDGVAKLTVGTTEPTSPSVGDLWYDTN